MGIYSLKNHNILKESDIDTHANEWEDDANSELIGNDSDTLPELEQEKNKYDMMHHKQRRVADWKSQELYKKTNIERYNELKSNYLRDIDNTEEEYEDIEISSESTISSDNKIDNINQSENDIILRDDINHEIPEYDDLKLKQAIEWSENSMIHIILPTKTLDDLDESWIKWRSMIRKHQRDSDNKSIELFGMTNKDHYDYIKHKFIGIKDDMSYDKTTKLDISNSAKKIEELISQDSDNKLQLSTKLFKLNDIQSDDIYGEVIKTEAVKNIQNKLDNCYCEAYDYIPSQLPYFTYDEIRLKTGEDNLSDYSMNYEGLTNEVSLKKWLESYMLLCNGIVDSELSMLTPLWINKVLELSIRLYKETDNDKRYKLKENILLLGWNSEVSFTPDNRIRATERVRNMISSKYKDDNIDMSEFVNNMAESDIDVLVTEQSSDSKLYPVYILLSYTNTTAGKIITKFNNSIYSHVAMSFDSSLQKLYSFNANVNGFSIESLDGYIKYNKNSIMSLNCIFVKKSDLELMNNKITELLLNIKNTYYSFINIIGIAINKSVQLNDTMICSQFVDYVLKLIKVDITNKSSGLVTPKDFELINNPKVYKLYEGKMINYNSRKIENTVKHMTRMVKYIKESQLNILNESEYIDYVFENYYDLNSLMYLSEKKDILSEQNRVIYNKYIEPYINIYINEAKEFPVQFDKDGNLLIKNKKHINFETEYSKSHKLLKIYDDTDNLEGIKYELAKLWFLNLLLESKLYNKSNEDVKEYHKVRARILNDFTKYLKIVSKKEPEFNFSGYYNNTPFSDETIKINNSTLKYSGKILKDILKNLIY